MEPDIMQVARGAFNHRDVSAQSQPTPAIGESQYSLTTDDKLRIEQAICDKHNYIDPEFTVFDAAGIVYIHRCPKCTEEREAKSKGEEERRDQQQRNECISRKMQDLNIGKRFKGMVFDDYIPTCTDAEKVKSVCQRYTKTFKDRLIDGDGLIFIGACGTGKNMLAAILCQEVVKQEKSAIHTTIFKLIRAIKDSWRRDSEKTEEKVINSFSDPDLLVIDEIGVQFGSDTEKLYLTEIINNRYENRKPTILISNLNLDELESVLGTRIIDRFYEGKSAILKFTWESYRRRKAESKPVATEG